MNIAAVEFKFIGRGDRGKVLFGLGEDFEELGLEALEL